MRDRRNVLDRKGRPCVTVAIPGKVLPVHDETMLVEVRDGEREAFATAVVLGVHRMRVCDVPGYLLDMHYDPSRRTHDGLREWARSAGHGTRMQIDVVVFCVKEA